MSNKMFYIYDVNDFYDGNSDDWLANLTAFYCEQKHSIPSRKQISLWLDICILIHNNIYENNGTSLECMYFNVDDNESTTVIFESQYRTVTSMFKYYEGWYESQESDVLLWSDFYDEFKFWFGNGVNDNRNLFNVILFDYSAEGTPDHAYYDIGEDYLPPVINNEPWSKYYEPELLGDIFDKLIVDKGFENGSQLARLANLNRSNVDLIRNNRCRYPKKETLLALCVAMKLTYEESEKFLNDAGYSFNSHSITDCVVKYYIKNRIYSVDEINKILIEHGEKPLGSRDRDDLY